MLNDMYIPQRVGFHDWYKNKKGREFPYGYTTIHRILAGKDVFGHTVSPEVVRSIKALFEEYEEDFPALRTTKT